MSDVQLVSHYNDFLTEQDIFVLIPKFEMFVDHLMAMELAGMVCIMG